MQDLYRGSSRFFLKEVFFSCSEDVLATPLRHLQRDYPAVQVGSYPDVSPVNNYLVRVALESKDVDLVEQVRMDRCHSRVMLSFAYYYVSSLTHRHLQSWCSVFLYVSLSHLHGNIGNIGLYGNIGMH